MTSSSSSTSFLTLVPRGLEWVIRDVIRQEHSGVISRVVAEPFPVDPSSRIQAHLAASKHKKADKKRKKNPSNKSLPETSLEKTLLQPAGTVQLSWNDEDSEGQLDNYSVGYYSRLQDNQSTGNSQDVLVDSWSMPGEMPGLVWMQLDCSSPAGISRIIVKEPRIGPLLVLAGLWERTPVPFSIDSLELASQQIRDLLHSDDSTFTLHAAYSAWSDHIQDYWKDVLTESQMEQLRRRLSAQEPLRFRLSCMRSHSRRYKYSRSELLNSIATTILPVNDTTTSTWTVDLKDYDLEIVVLLRESALAIGLSLRPNAWFGAQSFCHGNLPSEMTPPHPLLTRDFVGITRLRPSTARLLLQLAQLQVGDVVLDPCAGIGSIPLESERVLALGGDVALVPEQLASVASKYSRLVRALGRSRGESVAVAKNYSGLMAWDATYLPIRSSSVDAIVSDLPFGQHCLSAKQVMVLMPLLVHEMARVLRLSTGRMVLLCGNHVPVLEALHECNTTNDSLIWQLPCSSVFPVNIGGFIAWIILVRRGCGELSITHNDTRLHRIKTLARRRDRVVARR